MVSSCCTGCAQNDGGIDRVCLALLHTHSHLKLQQGLQTEDRACSRACHDTRSESRQFRGSLLGGMKMQVSARGMLLPEALTEAVGLKTKLAAEPATAEAA